MVWNLTFKDFRFDLIVFYCGNCFFRVKGLVQVGMFDRNILFIRQQAGKGSKIIWDIFEILIIYCIGKMVVSIWVFCICCFVGYVWPQLCECWLVIFAFLDCLAIGIATMANVGWS